MKEQASDLFSASGLKQPLQLSIHNCWSVWGFHSSWFSHKLFCNFLWKFSFWKGKSPTQSICYFTLRLSWNLNQTSPFKIRLHWTTDWHSVRRGCQVCVIEPSYTWHNTWVPAVYSRGIRQSIIDIYDVSSHNVAALSTGVRMFSVAVQSLWTGAAGSRQASVTASASSPWGTHSVKIHSVPIMLPCLFSSSSA